jgi:hypothetical protein
MLSKISGELSVLHEGPRGRCQRTLAFVQSFETPENHGHLLGKVAGLLMVPLVLAVLTPRGQPAR